VLLADARLLTLGLDQRDVVAIAGVVERQVLEHRIGEPGEHGGRLFELGQHQLRLHHLASPFLRLKCTSTASETSRPAR